MRVWVRLGLPGFACVIKVEGRTELKDRCRVDTRYYISSALLTAIGAAETVRSRWAIEISRHRVLNVILKEDQVLTRKAHGARNMAVVRQLGINLVRQADDLPDSAYKFSPAPEKSSAAQTRQLQPAAHNGRMGRNHPEKNPCRCNPSTWIGALEPDRGALPTMEV